MPLLSVAVPVPFLDELTYRMSDGAAAPPVGARVRVPVGSRTLTGCVVAHDPDPASLGGAEPKAIAEVLDEQPFLLPRIVELCRWVADYYMTGIGDALTVAMPPGSRLKKSGFKSRRIAAITIAGGQLAEGRLKDEGRLKAAPTYEGKSDVGAGFSRPITPTSDVGAGFSRPITPKQRLALETLVGAPAGLPLSELKERGIDAAILMRLARQGLVTIRSEQDERDPFERAALASVARDADRQLTGEQHDALDQLTRMADAHDFAVALLHGVTGSGKTEIYLRLAEHVVRAGRRVLLMVPEIALTPSVAALFRTTFGARLAIQHSGLSDGERHDQWQRIRSREVDVVIGTRSAVFAPMEDVGLVIVDEEHDGSYKQEESPRYHGRDVAIVRASREGALVVLGSATPSMETFQNAATGKYARVTLSRRVLDRPLARVSLVNMRSEYADEGPDVVISRALSSAIGERMDRREQVLVLLNRRGYATAVFCRQCGDTFECPNCSISLTVHKATRRTWGPENSRTWGPASAGPDSQPIRTPSVAGQWRARCHYCNYSLMVPATCRKCAAPYLEHAGFGTEKVEQQLRELFPSARVGRIDRDSVRRKGALAGLLTRFASREIDILVGTQMIAKGHDFPHVTLVGVISADVGLGLADFRAGERTFQLLTQVAGRAGRGTQPGEAIVQTLYPEHYSIQFACNQDYGAFFDKEIVFRRGMRYPPTVALINTIVKGPTFDDAMQVAAEIVRRLEPVATTSNFITLGPAPAPLGRLRGEHRVQFFLKGTRRAEMRSALKSVLTSMPEARRRVSVDVDPLNVL